MFKHNCNFNEVSSLIKQQHSLRSNRGNFLIDIPFLPNKTQISPYTKYLQVRHFRVIRRGKIYFSGATYKFFTLHEISFPKIMHKRYFK